MKAILQGIFIGSLLANFAQSEELKPASENEIKSLVSFFASCGSEVRNFPVIPMSEVRAIYFTTGRHQILPNDTETMLSFSVRKRLGDGGLSTIVFRFTVSPDVPDIEKIEPTKLSQYLNNRKITQYLVVESYRENGKLISTTLAKNVRNKAEKK